MRSREEDDELQQSTKKVKEVHQLVTAGSAERSYKEKLL